MLNGGIPLVSSGSGMLLIVHGHLTEGVISFCVPTFMAEYLLNPWR